MLTFRFMCISVCLWALSGHLACSRCWKQMHGVSESFILWDLYCWGLVISQEHWQSFPLSPFSVYSSFFLPATFKQGNQYSSIFPDLLCSGGQHFLHISITYCLNITNHSPNWPFYIVPPPTEIGLSESLPWAPLSLLETHKEGNNWRNILSAAQPLQNILAFAGVCIRSSFQIVSVSASWQVSPGRQNCKKLPVRCFNNQWCVKRHLVCVTEGDHSVHLLDLVWYVAKI